jgi:hypothetical protein
MINTFNSGFAVIIGVGGDLPVTKEDAQAVYNFLTDPSFCAYPKVNVRLLTEQLADRQHVIEALDELAVRVQGHPDATAIVYFSGHGIEQPKPNLLTYGHSFNDLDGTMLGSEVFTEKLRAIHSKKLLVVLDCCHAGAQGEAKAKSPPIPLSETAIQTLSQGSGRVILASSRRDEQSWTGNPYSIFTTAILEGLLGQGASEQDGFARVLDIAMWVNRTVSVRSRNRQNPIIKVAHLEDNFVVSYYAGGNQQPKSLPWSSSDEQILAEVDRLLEADELEKADILLRRLNENVLSPTDRQNAEAAQTEFQRRIQARLDAVDRLLEADELEKADILFRRLNIDMLNLRDRQKADTTQIELRRRMQTRLDAAYKKASSAREFHPKDYALQRALWDELLRLEPTHVEAVREIKRLDIEELEQETRNQIAKLWAVLDKSRFTASLQEVEDIRLQTELLRSKAYLKETSTALEVERLYQEVTEIWDIIRTGNDGASLERSDKYEDAIQYYRSAINAGHKQILDHMTGEFINPVFRLRITLEKRDKDYIERAQKRIQDAAILIKKAPEQTIEPLVQAIELMSKVEKGGDEWRRRAETLLEAARTNQSRMEQAAAYASESVEAIDPYVSLMLLQRTKDTYPEHKCQLKQFH